MRLIWNAGAAAAIMALLTITTSVASISGRAAKAVGQNRAATSVPVVTPLLSVEPISDLPHRHYSGLQEHFRAANRSEDGRLTLEQAEQAGWTRIVRHFTDIDLDDDGFITLDQIHAYNIQQRHGRKATDS